MSRGARGCLVALSLAWAACGSREVGPRSQDGVGVSAAELRRVDAEHPLARTVHASFYPLAFFAEELVRGTDLRVVCPVPPGDDPAFWEPTRDEARALRDGPLTLVHGASFERWLGYTALSAARTVVATDAMRDALRPYDEGATHSHGPAGSTESGGTGPASELAHSGIDAHTWLEPDLAEREAQVVLASLQRAFPSLAERFTASYADLAPSFEAWRRSVATTTDALEGERLVANHPAYEYLAHVHGWHIDNVELDPGELPDAEVRAQLSRLRAAGARFVLWESRPAAEVEAVVAALGLRCLVYSPCETLDEEARAAGENFLTVMLANLERLRSALRDTSR